MSYDQTMLRKVNTQIRNVEVDFKDTSRICVLNTEKIKNNLLNLAAEPGTLLTLNLQGVKFIDSQAFLDLNHLSRTARNYNSTIALSNVETSVMELIELIKKHSVFDIKTIKPAKVANQN